MPTHRPISHLTLLVGLLVALTSVAAPSIAHPQTTSAGRIEGTVVLSTALSTRRPRYRPYAERGQVAQVPASSADEDKRRNVVIYLEKVHANSAELPPAPLAPAIRQTEEPFALHVLTSDMSAIVLVLENPFFTTPVDEGRYVLENVPPGEYTIVGWHERIRPVTRRVRVAAGETARVDFDIPLPLQAANR